MKFKSVLLILFILLCISNIGCGQNSSVSAYSNKRYQDYKSNFEEKFTIHFPAKISDSKPRDVVFSARDDKKNDFSLILYEYDVPSQNLKDIRRGIKNACIATYRTSDPCLFIVNRFETRETIESYSYPNIDSTLLNKACYKDKYPIPNFVNYEEYKEAEKSVLDDSFTIYILESKKVNSWEKEFNMGPAAQMPDIWKNGYSRGIALSEEKRTVIYWTVIW